MLCQVVCVSVAGKVSGADLAAPGQTADRLAWKWAAPLSDVEVVEGMIISPPFQTLRRTRAWQIRR